MAKKIAILVREKQSEAIRMSVGLTLADDLPTVFVMDRKLEEDEGVALNVETLGDLDVKIYTNTAENSNFELKSTEEIARDLVNYDAVIAY
ncbi:MAG: hypothetical protein AB1632_13015 [Nitrospirota bacterium]